MSERWLVIAQVELAVEERCEFIPFVQISSCHTDPATGRVRVKGAME